MPLDAIAVRAQVNELQSVTGFKIDKIQQPEKDMIILSLRGAGRAERLLVSANSANARVHLTGERPENPPSPPMFCMLLRKHLTGGRITAIRQKGFERIIDIEIESYTELGDSAAKHLVCEIMGRNSNIIFLNEEMKIIDSIKHVDITVSSVRNILPGLKYVLPPSGDRLDPEISAAEDFYAALSGCAEGMAADKAACSAVEGISPLMARECVFRACGDGSLKIGEMSEENLRASAAEMEKMFRKAKAGEFSPCILLKPDKTAADFAPFTIRQYGGAVDVQPRETMNAAVEEFYLRRDRDARMKNHSAALTKVVGNNLSRAAKKLNLLQSDLKASLGREKYRVYGDLLTANLYRVNKGDKNITVENYYEEGLPKVVIPLDESKSPSQNVKNYYNKYKKAKNTEIYSKEQIEKTKKEIEYLESVSLALENAASLKELGEIKAELENEGYIKNQGGGKKRPKTAAASEPMEFDALGYKVLIGRNNAQNDYLTLKIGRSRDLWLHTKNIAGSHTLIKYQGEDFPPEVITRAAELAAYYSKGKNSPKVEVDYCPVSHVRKPNGAKAGMVIYEGYNTAVVEPKG